MSTTNLALSIDSAAKLEKDGDILDSSIQIQLGTEDGIGMASLLCENHQLFPYSSLHIIIICQVKFLNPKFEPSRCASWFV